MRAQVAVLRKLGEELSIEEVEIRALLAGEVLIKIRASGICHSDLSVQNGVLPFPLPIVLGHEGAGEIVEISEGVTSVVVGDHVIINNIPECGKCRQCLSPFSNICVETGYSHQTTQNPFNIPNYKPIYKSDTGEEIRTMLTAGTFATYSIAKANCVTPIPKDFPLEEACLIACGVMTGVGCTHYATQVTPGSSVAVFGLGSIGLNVIQGAKLGGATIIIALDILDSKEAIARQFGATHFINPTKLDKSLADVIKEITNGSVCVDFAFEATGNTTVLQTATSIVHPFWGVVVAVGIPHHGAETKLGGSTFAFGRTVKGVYFGNAKPISAGKQILGWVAEKKIQIQPLITHRITLKEVNKGLALLAKGEAIRAVILYD